MSYYTDEDTHAALWASETYESPAEGRWLAWVGRLEGYLGVANDRLEEFWPAGLIDESLIDVAHDWWTAGLTAAEAAIEARAILQEARARK